MRLRLHATPVPPVTTASEAPLACNARLVPDMFALQEAVVVAHEEVEATAVAVAVAVAEVDVDDGKIQHYCYAYGHR